MLSQREIEYIIAIHKTKSITKAAAVCHVSQPALTMQINAIENKLGVKIFDRHRNKTTPTLCGLEVIKIGTDILCKLDEIANIKSVTPQISIGIIPTVSPYLLPKVVNQCGNEMLKLYFYEQKTKELILQVQSGKIQYGILAYYKDILPKDIQYKAMYTEELLFASNKALNVKFNDVVNDMILLEDDNCLNISISEICKAQKVKHQFSATSIDVVKAMILNNNGYGILPKNLIHKEEEKLFNLQSFKPIATREIGIIYKDPKHLDTVLKTFGSCV